MGNNSEPDKLVIDRGLFREQLERRISIGSEILGREIISDLQLKQAGADYEDWDSYNSELLKCSFNNSNNEYRKDYDCVRSIILLGGHKYSFSDWIESHKGRVQEKLDRLIRLEKKTDLLRSNLESSPMGKTQVACSKDKIFIVHGHDEAVREKVARFLEKLGLKPIILDGQANAGKTIIEKFEHYASNAGFAVILLTDDDIGESKNAESTKPRARQNVIFEYGYFVGKLGRDRTCQLYKNGLELPSDLHGVVYSSLDDRGWKMDLAKELKAAGYKIDLNKLL